ncbi:MAG TPA: PfkB family carbohydrate kinase [Acidimicrobiales bacterium]|nr:PfkB family carbohydrate kinase [Acidimicrobiales bacterium]
MRAQSAPRLVVVGQVGRDLVLQVEALPAPGVSGRVLARREVLGGKGANQAVAGAQLGAQVSIIGVVGDDHVADTVLGTAGEDGVDVGWVIRRAGTPTGLITEVIDSEGTWRYLEDLPEAVLLSEDDVTWASPAMDGAQAVVVQLQQPPEAALLAAQLASRAGCAVILDGALPDDWRRGQLLRAADVVRCDTHEAELVVGADILGGEDARRHAEQLRASGPSLVVLGAGRDGNALAWEGGSAVLPLVDTEVVDTTGAGAPRRRGGRPPRRPAWPWPPWAGDPT